MLSKHLFIITIFIKISVYHRNLSFQLARTSLCQESSLKPAWASSTNTSLMKHKQLSDWCMPKLQRLILFTGGSDWRYGHNPWLRIGQIPPQDEHFQELNNSEDSTLQCTNILHKPGILIAWRPKFILNSSECNFACLSVENISNLVLNHNHQ